MATKMDALVSLMHPSMILGHLVSSCNGKGNYSSIAANDKTQGG